MVTNQELALINPVYHTLLGDADLVLRQTSTGGSFHSKFAVLGNYWLLRKKGNGNRWLTRFCNWFVIWGDFEMYGLEIEIVWPILLICIISFFLYFGSYYLVMVRSNITLSALSATYLFFEHPFNDIFTHYNNNWYKFLGLTLNSFRKVHQALATCLMHISRTPTICT